MRLALLRARARLNASPWGSRFLVCSSRGHATDAAKDSAKTYSATLLLPRTKFKLWTDPKQREESLRNRTTETLYAWQWKHNRGPIFINHDGPPYANGDLHMGHALNKILKDVINRFQVLQGRRVNYIPGWDCHGLPIETKALQKLKAAPNTLPASKVRKAAEAFAKSQVESQRKEFQTLTIMADWSSDGTYRTLDRSYEIRQLHVFRDMVRKNLIYRKHRPVHWSPSSVTALAEAELKYVDYHVSQSAYITFTVPSLDHMSSQLQEVARALNIRDLDLLIWTTTPWTIPANMAIAVNPELAYAIVRKATDVANSERPFIVAQDLIAVLEAVVGKLELIASIPGSVLLDTSYDHIFHPHVPSKALRVLPSRHVSSTSGTGVVHMAPAHGAEDYGVFVAAGLLQRGASDVVCPVDGTGRFNEEILELARNAEHGKRLLGKEVLTEGTEEVLSILKEAGTLVARREYKHRYPYDSRTNKPMIVRATSQWFANVDDIKDDVFDALKSVQFHPQGSRARMEAFIRERSEWCISRQRVWGTPIPSLHDAKTGEAFLTSSTVDNILGILERKGVAYWWEGPVEEFLTPELADSGRTFVKGTDTIDVWFDSGSSWTILRPIEPASQNIRVADVCLEGSDQHRGWFQSLLLTAVGSSSEGEHNPAPFKNLITHGFVLDEDGRKMSKSVGNIIRPSTVISGGKDLNKQPAYGADVLRLWSASVDYTKDVSVGPKAIAQIADSLRKLRNTTRFILGNTSDGRSLDTSLAITKDDMTLTDRYVMHQLLHLERTALEAYATFNFHAVVHSLLNFTNSTLSALYFDVSKDILYADATDSVSRRAVVTVLIQVLDTMTSIFAPILPNLAEEIHEIRSVDHDGSSVFQKQWKPLDREWDSPTVQHDMEQLLSFRQIVLQLLEQARREGAIRSSLEAVIAISLPSDSASSFKDILQSQKNHLPTLFVVSDVSLEPDGNNRLQQPRWEYNGVHGDVRIYVRPSPKHKCPRCWQWMAPEVDHLCPRCSQVVPHLSH